MPARTPDDDGLTLNRIDREIRLNEAWHAADAMAREHIRERGLWGEEEERQIDAWRDLFSFDTAPDTSEYEILRCEGIEMPAPEEMDGATLTAKLWEVIHALAARNTFLERTDHLSDRELYTHLVEDTFHEITKDLFRPEWNSHLDILGGCSEEDLQLSLRYYSDDEERADWVKQFPEDPMPPKEKLPYDRDRHLPKARHE